MSTLRSRTIRLAHEHPELREHLLPVLKNAAKNEHLQTMSDAELVSELIQTAFTPDHKNLKAQVSNFVHEFVLLGIKYNDIVETMVKQVEGWFPPDKVNRDVLEKEIRKLVEFSWGSDPGSDVLARILAKGQYLT